MAYSLASHPSRESTKIEGIVNIMKDINPTNGDFVKSIVRLTTI